MSELKDRGLYGIELIVSDAHEGLKAARRAVFPSVPWQRCQFHLQQNAGLRLLRVKWPKKGRLFFLYSNRAVLACQLRRRV
jgi:transposase-like protein